MLTCLTYCFSSSFFIATYVKLGTFLMQSFVVSSMHVILYDVIKLGNSRIAFLVKILSPFASIMILVGRLRLTGMKCAAFSKFSRLRFPYSHEICVSKQKYNRQNTNCQFSSYLLPCNTVSIYWENPLFPNLLWFRSLSRPARRVR